MTGDDWLDAAKTDARRRQLPALDPMLEALARATRALRAAEWNLDAASRPATDTDETDDSPGT